jgi:hypothetical protein
MNLQDLDQLIDAAAEQLVGREPSRGLTDAVMARVRATEGAGFGAPSSKFWFPGLRFWLSSAAVITAAAIIFFVLKTPPAPIQRPERSASQPAQQAQPSIAAVSGPPVAVPIASRPTAKYLPDRSPRSIVDDAGVTMFFVDDPIVMEPIKADPIDADPIDVAPIAVAASQPPPPIQIEPLIIEPISSSND